ncbi:hypothetical protein IFM89_012169 [Coptis chinensis]|uniref:Uncharacterized protein n=1 Tax=Coptis chinensis TaxID=261450 RepID=A0A835HDH7_9MAGN|nr:hypothetical protein IFM89_012169 [Coptis chinensis]
MALDPHIHTLPSPLGPNVVSSAFSSTSHMAHRESAMVEAEERLSEEILLFGSSQSNLLSVEKPDCDYFLCIWNLEVGKSFQRQAAQETSQSPNFQASSLTKYGVGRCGTSQCECVHRS